MNIDAAFSSSYGAARQKFLQAAAAAGARLESLEHPLRGRDGETLAVDVALDGAADADKLLIVSSGCHGVEGFCGSGPQVLALHDSALRAQARAHGVALLHLHALNPYGFSHLRRVTHENVDLNRNFQNFSQALPDNPGYRALHPLLLPRHWPPNAWNRIRANALILRHGLRPLQDAFSTGQYEFPQGLFFGGTEPCWSNLTLRRILRAYGRHARHVAWVDLHSGLGPSGYGERGNAGHDDEATLGRARQWWGSDGATPVQSLAAGSSVSSPLMGVCWWAVYDECPQAQFTGVGIEFGTIATKRVAQALRAEQWLALHPEAEPQLAAQIKQELKDAFYVDNSAWKQRVAEQSLQAMHQGIRGLGGSA